MTIDHPNLLHLLWAVPALVAVYVFGFARKRAALGRFATVNLLGQLIPQVSTARQKFKAALVLAVAALLIVALAGPRWGSTWEEVHRKGVDLIIALDVSRSMLAEENGPDRPNRLERSVVAIGDLLEQLEGDRVGLITFAGTPTKKSPLTINYGAFKAVLDEVDTNSAPRGGSMLGDAIRLARGSFVDQTKDFKALILISDGGDGDRSSYPVEATSDAYDKQGAVVYTVGVGDAAQGGRIPVEEGGKRTYLQHEGQEVWTKLTPDVLQEVAVAGHGKYLQAAMSNFDLGPVYQDIRKKLGVTEFEAKRIERKNPQFQWFVAGALLLLLIETMMTDRRPKAAAAAAENERAAA